MTGRLIDEPGPLVWWVPPSPQGKIQAEGLSSFADGAFWLDVDAGVADGFLKRMKMYRLRAGSRSRTCARRTLWAGMAGRP